MSALVEDLRKEIGKVGAFICANVPHPVAPEMPPRVQKQVINIADRNCHRLNLAGDRATDRPFPVSRTSTPREADRFPFRRHDDTNPLDQSLASLA